MIQVELIEKTILGKTVQLTHTWSDAGKKIRKLGTDEIYESAYDLTSNGYTYTETEELIEKEETENEENFS